MGWFSFLFGGGEKMGRIYSKATVKPELAEAAEIAISESRYKIFGKNASGRSVLTISGRPNLVVLITRHSFYSGDDAPDMVIDAVYPVDSDPTDLAHQLVDMINER